MKPILQGMGLVAAFVIVALLVLVSATRGRTGAVEQATAPTSAATTAASSPAAPATSGTSAATPATTSSSSSAAATGASSTATTSTGTTSTGSAASAAVASAEGAGSAIKVGNQTLNGTTQAGLNVYERACMSCHNRDGQSFILQYPRLSAQVAAYTADQLHAFAQGTRANAIMTPIAQTLTPQQIADLAAYLAAAPVSKDGWGKVNDTLRAKGEQLYRQGNGNGAQACMACHGANGEGQAAAGFPRLAGQTPTYFVTRIGEFAHLPDTVTGNAAVMAKIAKALKPDETRAIGEYLKTLN